MVEIGKKDKKKRSWNGQNRRYWSFFESKSIILLFDVNTNWQNEETANKKLKLDLKRLKYIVRTHLREECGQGIFDANNFDNNECWEFLTAGKKKTSTREPTQENGPETGSSSVTENSSRNGVTHSVEIKKKPFRKFKTGFRNA